MNSGSVPSTVTEGERVVVAFEIVDHGSEHAQFFQGCGISLTDFEECATGCGDSAAGAFEDALDSLASGGWDVDNVFHVPGEGQVAQEPCAECSGRGCDECDEGMRTPEDVHYYVSVRVRGPKARIELFRARALAEAHRGKAARLAGKIPDAVRHERNVDLALTSAEHELGRSGRLDIEDALSEIELSM